MQAVANHFGLGCELSLVRELLKVAATAAAEVRTRWFNSDRRRPNDLFNRSKQDVPLPSYYRHANAVSGRRKRNKNSLPAGMGQPHPAGKNSFYVNPQMLGHRCSTPATKRHK